MSGSAIPNLLSLRGSRGGRGRGHRSRRGDPAAGRTAGDHDKDVTAQSTVQGTDTDAAISRLSAVQVGLLDDRFAQLFVQSAPGQVARRLPIINRGQPPRFLFVLNTTKPASQGPTRAPRV